MWFYLSIVLIIGSVQSLTIGYPYRTLLTYEPIRSHQKAAGTQGYLIYLDNSGIERVVSFDYAEPVYAIRQINYINREAPVYTKFVQDDSSELVKAREAHFRAWSLQQYQVLKREIDFLRGEGKEPTIEMLLKFLPLEKIALTSDYSTIAKLPEIQRIRKEHLNIWNQVLQADEDKIQTDIKVPYENKEEIAVKPLNREGQGADIKELHPFQNKTQSEDKFEIKQSDGLEKIKAEVKFATKIDTESEILSIESPPSNYSNLKIDSPLKLQSEVEKTVSTSLTIDKENLAEPIKSNKTNITIYSNQSQQLMETIKFEQKLIAGQPNKIENNKNSSKGTTDHISTQVPPQQVLDTPEMIKTREEHLKTVMEAKKKNDAQKKILSEVEKLISIAPKIYVPQQVVDTVEVMRARDEHLRIVHEAIQKAKLANVQELQKEIVTNSPDIVSNKSDKNSTEITTKSK